MAININVSGGVQGGSNIPTAGEMKDFSNDIKKADTMDLIKAKNDPNTEQWQKDAIDKELSQRGAANQAGGASGGEGTQEDKDEIAKLLKKLADGTISQDELQKLAGMLKVDPKELEAQKGKGGSSGEGTGQSQDIQGG